MHKEAVSTKHALLFFVIIIISAGLIFMSLLNYFDIKKFKWIFELIIVFLVSIGIYIFQKFLLTVYNYTMVQNFLIFKKFVGKKETILFNIDINDIDAIYEYGEFLKVRNKQKIKRLLNLSGHFKKLKMYVLVYNDGKKKSALKFCPSDDFYNMLSNKIKFHNEHK